MSDTSFGYGQEMPNDSGSDYGAIAFVCRQLMARMDTAKLVQVVAVHGGGVAVAGTVDVLPLVQQIDGNGYGTPHGVVYGLPWSRLQGGTNAVICDPVTGDVGYVVASDRDTSIVRAQSPGFSTMKGFLPGTRRRFSISDGVYAGGCLNVVPNQYLIFTVTGIRIVDKNGNSIAMSPTGMTLTDNNANQIIMAAGFVNIITTSFEVNGIPVTIP